MPEFVNPKPDKYDFELDAKGAQTGALVCKKCKSSIMAKTVTHPIWDGPFPCSGSGRVHSEQVPYCPKCEKEPSSFGTPLDEDPADKREREILRRIAEKRARGDL